MQKNRASYPYALLTGFDIPRSQEPVRNDSTPDHLAMAARFAEPRGSLRVAFVPIVISVAVVFFLLLFFLVIVGFFS